MRLHGSVPDLIHLSATDEAEIAKFTHLKGYPHTFVYIVSIPIANIRYVVDLRLF